MVDSHGQEIGDLLGVTHQAAKTVHMTRAAERVRAATDWPVTGLLAAFWGFGETDLIATDCGMRIDRRLCGHFERLGPCHRKGESAVGVSTDSETSTI